MIIELLMSLVYNVINFLTPFTIPSLPSQFLNYIQIGINYMAVGAQVVSHYVPLTYCAILMGVVLIVDASVRVYRFAMWVIKKIPLLNIKD